MFSLNKETLLKRDIIEILDTQTHPITVKEIQRNLSAGSRPTILALCRELQMDFEVVYRDARARIKISSNGILLTRHGSSLQYIMDYLFSADLTYTIMTELVRRRSVPVVSFCFENGISESTLKRKVRTINDSLQHHKVKITVSRSMILQGDEVDIRVILYSFLSNIHRQFSRIPWLKQEKTIPLISRSILDYLGIEDTDINIELLSIWVYVTSTSISYKRNYTLSEQRQQILQSLTVPEKPKFLRLWTVKDWQVTAAVMYGSDIYGAFIERREIVGVDRNDSFESFLNHWLMLFERYFIKLTDSKRKIVADQIFQQFVHGAFLSSIDELVNKKAFNFDFSQFAQTHRYYAVRFECFWQGFSTYLSNQGDTLQYLKVSSLFLCIALCPFRTLQSDVVLYLYTDLPHFHENYLQEQLCYFLQQNLKIRFTTDVKEATLIVTTVPLPISEKIKTDEQMIILIRPTLQENDLKELLTTIQESL